MALNIEESIVADIAGKRNKASRERALRQYYSEPNHCLHCGGIIYVPANESTYRAREKKFCCIQCAVAYNAKIKTETRHRNCKRCGRKLSWGNSSGLCAQCLKKSNDEERIKVWKETGDTGCCTSSTLKNCIRDYILEQQDGLCAICHIEPEWNGMELHFILDHFDGDASNNDESNLRLICPNCDSQLDTYKSRNKNSARSHRRINQMADELGGCPEPT